jgi:hypothetical protein
MKPIYALSIKQPWSFLIAKGFKDIENRSWSYMSRLPDGCPLPPRIYIHASKKPDVYEGLNEWIIQRLNLFSLDAYNQIKGKSWSELCSFGAIIGEVTIACCVVKSNSPWFVGEYGWVLENPVLYDVAIPCKGKLGFFKPEVEVVK